MVNDSVSEEIMPYKEPRVVLKELVLMTSGNVCAECTRIYIIIPIEDLISFY